MISLFEIFDKIFKGKRLENEVFEVLLDLAMKIVRKSAKNDYSIVFFEVFFNRLWYLSEESLGFLLKTVLEEAKLDYFQIFLKENRVSYYLNQFLAIINEGFLIIYE